MDYDDITDDEEFVEFINEVLRAPRRVRPRKNHFIEWSDQEFKQRFRMSKPVVQYILDKISEDIASATDRNNALSPADMLFVTLRYLATGSMLKVIGDLSGIDKATASRAVTKVIHALARLRPQFIELPTDPQELDEIKQGFYDIARFPRCIGALDCTHVKIASPGGQNAELFRNRKNFFSYNVQALCDSNLIIRNIVARWHGAAHDSTIFNSSRLKGKLERGDYGEDSLILGDGGYAVKKYIITPLGNPQTQAEQLFNESQIRTRNRIERCFGVLKRRFPVLALGIRLARQKVEGVIVAAAVLHNIARHMADDVPLVTEEEERAIQLTEGVNIYQLRRANRNLNDNNVTRHILITRHFQNLLE